MLLFLRVSLLIAIIIVDVVFIVIIIINVYVLIVYGKDNNCHDNYSDAIDDKLKNLKVGGSR